VDEKKNVGAALSFAAAQMRGRRNREGLRTGAL
jgi:hypothetical protein